MGRTLGVDPGQRRVGLALDDEAGQALAMPFGVVERGIDDAKAAAKVAQALEGVELDAVVMGLPLRLDGTEGAAARRARRFAAALEAALGHPVELLDERLSTVAAERTLREMGVRGKAQRAVVDETAAAILLQSYLDRREYRRRQQPSASSDSWPDASED
ncbi:MAG: Holliday junction resolvase RuvX [Sandaracinus sp.]|nr:Holliday junction resolvase RuvX [Sandaracinus sp.]